LVLIEGSASASFANINAGWGATESGAYMGSCQASLALRLSLLIIVGCCQFFVWSNVG
jgi:hypothetical protein